MQGIILHCHSALCRFAECRGADAKHLDTTSFICEVDKQGCCINKQMFCLKNDRETLKAEITLSGTKQKPRNPHRKGSLSTMEEYQL